MSTFAEDLRPDLDEIRGILGELGLSTFKVFVRVRTWSGHRIGEGVSEDVTQQLLVAGFSDLGVPQPQPVRVKQKSQKDVIASGGSYDDQDLLVGPFTPAYPFTDYAAGGLLDGQVDPVPTPKPAETHWIVYGPGIPPQGAVFAKISEEVTSLHYKITLRRMGASPA